MSDQRIGGPCACGAGPVGHDCRKAAKETEARYLALLDYLEGKGPRPPLVQRATPQECPSCEALRSQLAEARETNVRLNRRCQAYEAGLKEKIGGGSRGFGRMLANAAATMEKERADAAEKALVEARRESTEWIDSLRADVRHALEERDEAREEIERLTRETGAMRADLLAEDKEGEPFGAGPYRRMAGRAIDKLDALRAFLDEVKPVLSFAAAQECHLFKPSPTCACNPCEARTLIGRWPK